MLQKLHRGKNDFVMEIFGRHHLHQVMKVSITNNGINEHQALTHGIQ